jgi:type 1 glutamine amidotransferase
MHRNLIPNSVLSRAAVLLFAGALLVLTGLSGLAAQPRVLLFSKNQVGNGLYVHDNVDAASAAINRLCAENGIAVDSTDDSSAFSDANLSKYRAIIFNNTNNEVLETESQTNALVRFIRSGGGFVGIHSATGTMRKWPWFWSLVGGKFARHARLQTFTVKVKDPQDPSTAHLPSTFQWDDEFYYVEHMPEGLHILLAGDLTKLDDPGKEKYPGRKFGDEFPLAWRHEFEGGRAWYTALGHKPEHYSDPRLVKHLLGGIQYAIGK